jgi:hypothetical protein
MMRVSPATRARVMQIAAEDYGGVTADEALQRLADEHWERKAIEAMDRFRRDDPQGYADYLGEMREWDAIDAPVSEPWDDGSGR